MQHEMQKVQAYKSTIKKQELVISKYEKLLEDTLKDTEKSRAAQVELEKVRTENIGLQKQLKSLKLYPPQCESFLNWLG